VGALGQNVVVLEFHCGRKRPESECEAQATVTCKSCAKGA